LSSDKQKQVQKSSGDGPETAVEPVYSFTFCIIENIIGVVNNPRHKLKIINKFLALISKMLELSIPNSVHSGIILTWLLLVQSKTDHLRIKKANLINALV
jgi:hypothetical protein